MADIPMACEVHRWRGLPIPQLALPHVDRWYAGIRNRDAARGVFDIELS
jgi:glutathione S-transferase